MPGVGDFNLRSFFRALGIKNPQPSMREFVQPVIIAGDMSEITPQYRPPTGVFGGDVAGAAGEFSWIQLVSRAEGGSLVSLATASNFKYATDTNPLEDTPFTNPHPLHVQLSVEPPVSLVLTAASILIPQTSNRSPSSIDQNDRTEGYPKMMWIRPGGNIVFFRTNTNTSINSWSLTVVDLPASENSIL